MGEKNYREKLKMRLIFGWVQTFSADVWNYELQKKYRRTASSV